MFPFADCTRQLESMSHNVADDSLALGGRVASHSLAALYLWWFTLLA
jgi:hypothetical protein